ncbi:MAG: 16S rRNA (cytosine(1402)-N(4))-methyltransferase RsmH [Gammaproteobacteria bacterium]
MTHVPVMLKEALEGLAIKPDGIYIDATFGRGGHSGKILEALEAQGRLIAIDHDPEAAKVAKERFGNDKRFHLCQGTFAHLANFAQQCDVVGKVSGIFFDLGVSSPQLDNPERGFSFLHDGPLDMRMNPDEGISAAKWLSHVKEKTLVHVLKEYGEERFARRIANAIVTTRRMEAITTTKKLAGIIAGAVPTRERGKHPATRSFQAIRIFINKELEYLQSALAQSIDLLETGGRLAVISFHSLEDRIVKNFIREQSRGKAIPKGVVLMESQIEKALRAIGKAQKPSADEVRLNSRARSAVLRIAEKL